MAILRIVKKHQNFVILDKTCLSESKLSFGAKGLHAYLMSMPDNWKVQVISLQKCSTNGRDAVRGFLTELETLGYIKKSLNRDQETGKLGGYDYLVLETPEPELLEDSPATGNPATGNPAPVNPPLTNNNKLNNKTTTANIKEEDCCQQQGEAAAVFSFNQKSKSNNVMLLSKDDALISDKLTSSQKHRIDSLVESLNVEQKEELKNEIVFCMLNPKHFSACGDDFSRKLNAIRGVILRGSWQTPAGMLSGASQAQKTAQSAIEKLEVALRGSYAEVNHFKRLLASTGREDARANFETIIHQAQNKINSIQQQLDLQRTTNESTADARIINL